jgi:DNA-binding IscR family transcriptional regulator
MDEVVLALEGEIAPMDCFVEECERRVSCSHLTDGGAGCATRMLWTRVQDAVVDALRRTTLAELVLFGGPTETHPLFTLSH